MSKDIGPKEKAQRAMREARAAGRRKTDGADRPASQEPPKKGRKRG